MTEGLSFNTSLTQTERMEIFMEVLEPRWKKEWKSMLYNPILCLRLFHLLQRLQAFEFELTAKAFNAYATNKKIGNLDLMVEELRNARKLQGELNSLRETGLSHSRWHKGAGGQSGVEGRLQVAV
jgi:hypothetical protein